MTTEHIKSGLQQKSDLEYCLSVTNRALDHDSNCLVSSKGKGNAHDGARVYNGTYKIRTTAEIRFGLFSRRRIGLSTTTLIVWLAPKAMEMKMME